jgi:hypothetical protein
MAQQSARESLKLRGRATGVESVILAPFVAGVPVSAEFRSDKLKDQPRVFVRPLGSGGVRVRLKFPRNTPPGSYQGTVRIGATEYITVAEVAAEPHLKFVPSRLYFSATAGKQETVDLTVVNSGNQPYEIRSAHGFGLFATGGIEDALGAAYRESKQGGLERLAILADKLAEAHGGLVRVKVESGAGMIEPDQVRELRLQLRFPDNLRSGSTYGGILRIQDARCALRIDVPSKTVEEVR